MRARVCILATLIGCGGRVDGADASADATGDAPHDVAQGDSGWTTCESPSGIGICGGPNNCGAQCANCGNVVDASELRACGDVSPDFDVDAGVAWDGYICPDGALNACHGDENAPACWENACVAADLPRLYLLNGRADLARYADRSTYTGDPLPPPPTTCPSVSAGLQLCGGACGACQPTKVCTGRSPLHPYSLCVDSEPTSFPCTRGTGGYCDSVRSGFMCLTFKVDSAAQSIADQSSVCVDGATCQAAAQSYPGGAVCTPGST